MIKDMRIILTESRVDSARILEILTASKPANKEDPNYSYYKELADWANPGRNQAGKEINLDKSNTQIKISDRSLIDNNPTKLAKRYNNLGALLTVVKGLMDATGYNPNNATSKLIQKTTIEILASLSNKYPKQEQPKNEQTTLRQGMDWTSEKAKRLANANGEATSDILEKFYNDYYKIEYAGLKSPSDEDSTGIVAHLHSLDSILIKEFNKLGYSPDINPLAQYLKIVIKEKPAIFKKLTPNTYGAIHNSFIDGQLKGNTLGNYNVKHLLFCEDLYNYKGLEIVKYLKLYNTTLTAAKDSVGDEGKWSLAAKIFIQQALPDNPEQKGQQPTFADKVKALHDLQEVNTPANPTAKLRSLSEIEELHTYIFGKTPSTEKAEESKAVQIIKLSIEQHKLALDMLNYIINIKQFKNKYAKEASRWAESLSIKAKEGSYQYSKEKNDRCAHLLSPKEAGDLQLEDLLKIAKTCINLANKQAKK